MDRRAPRLAPQLLLAFIGSAAAAGAQTPLWRINCGGDAQLAPSGPPFLADQAYDSSTHGGFIFGSPTGIQLPIGGANNPYATIHSTARVGWRSYRFDLPNGNYLVRLHFAEV